MSEVSRKARRNAWLSTRCFVDIAGKYIDFHWKIHCPQYRFFPCWGSIVTGCCRD